MLKMILSFMVLAAFLIMIGTSQLSVVSGQTTTGIVATIVNVSSLPATSQTSNGHVMPYPVKDPSSYANLKAQSNGLQSVKVFENYGEKPLGNTGSVALNIQPGGFDGLNEASSGNFIPPDVAMASGPNHIVEMVNLEYEIWSKSGSMISRSSLWSFYGIPGTDFLSDPQIFYDPLSSRWFASVGDFTTNNVYFAASTSNDPTSTWNIYHLPFGNCPDQPQIGDSSDKFVISANDFANSCNGAFTGEEYYVIDKNQIMSGSALTNYKDFPADNTKFGFIPAKPQSSTSTIFIASIDTGASVNRLHYFTITGTASNPTTQETNLAIQATSTPPNAQQPGTISTIDTGDGRILDVKWSQGKLWVSFNDGCTISGDSAQRSCLRLIQIDTGSALVLQDYDFGASGYYYFYPALSIDNSGNLGIVFGYSSASAGAYPSLAVTGQPANSIANHFEDPLTLKTGSVTDTSGRYGDYFSASTDPSNSNIIWVAGEYRSSSPWSTFISSIEFNTCAPPSTGDWTVSSSCTLSTTVNPPANVIVQSRAVLTIPNGLKLNIDFTHYHLLVKSGGGVLIKAGGTIN